MKQNDQHFIRSTAMKTISFLAVSITVFAITMGMAHKANRSAISSDQALNGAFTDGVYLGSLAAQRGEAPHIAYGRWSKDTDRKSFSDGYTATYNQTVALMTVAKPLNQNTQGAYRDGIYLGKLDAEQGRSEHIATGRWAQATDKESFSAGYRESYSDALARAETNGPPKHFSSDSMLAEKPVLGINP
jgi:hypothetical protein